MSKPLHTWTVPGVEKAKRRSPRIYTHAIVGRADLAAARARIEERAAGAGSLPRVNYAYYRRILEAGIGGTIDLGGRGRTVLAVVDSDDHTRASQELADCATAGDYAAKVLRRELDLLARQHPTGEAPLRALQWSQSYRAASRALGTWTRAGYKDLEIRETVEAGK